MHSLAMAQDILEAALIEAKKHHGERIKAITVRIGEEDFLESDSLQFCLEAMAKGTIAEGARMEVELVSTMARCRGCDFVFPVEDHLPICPRCGEGDLEIILGDEPLSVRLTME